MILFGFFATLSLALLYVLNKKDGDARTGLILLFCGSLLAPGFALTALRSAPAQNLDNLRIALEAVEFPIEAASKTVFQLGGDAGRDDLVVAGMPADLVTAVAEGANGAVRVTASAPAPFFASINGRPGGQALLCGDANCSAAKISVCNATSPPKPPGLWGRLLAHVKSLVHTPGPCGDNASEVRSFRASLVRRDDGAMVRVLLDTPQVSVLQGKDLRDEAAQRTGVASFQIAGAIPPPTITYNSASQGPRPIESIAILGGVFRDQLQQVIDVRPYDSDAKTDGITVHASGGDAVVPSGRTIALGESAHAIVRFTRIDRGWIGLSLAVWVILLGALTALAATWQQRRAPAVWALFLWLEVLLTFRILIAFEAGMISRSPAAFQALPRALIAYALCPLILSLFTAAKNRRPLLLFAHAAFVFYTVLAVKRNFGDVADLSVWPYLAYAGCIAALACGVTALWPYRRVSLPIFPWVARHMCALAPKNYWSVLALVGVAVLVRGIAIALGFKEEITLGVRVSFSIFFVPLLAFLTGYLFVWQTSAERFERRYANTFLVVAAILGLAIPKAAHDIGAAIYLFPVLLLAAIAGPRRQDGTRSQPLRPAWFDTSLLAATALLCVVALFLYTHRILPLALYGSGALMLVCFGVMCWRAPRAAWMAPALLVLVGLFAVYFLSAYQPSLPDPRSLSPSRLKTAIQDYSEVSRNQQRLLALSAPQLLADLGTKEAEELSAAVTHMADYASAKPLGAGYLNVAPSSELQRYQMNDNVSAIHLLAPYGRLGTAFFLIAQILAAGVVTAARFPDARAVSQATPGSICGLLCLWTLVFVSLYMVLANAGLVPFTGRNVYLLSVASIGDVIEAMVLFCIARMTLTEARP